MLVEDYLRQMPAVLKFAMETLDGLIQKIPEPSSTERPKSSSHDISITEKSNSTNEIQPEPSTNVPKSKEISNAHSLPLHNGSDTFTADKEHLIGCTEVLLREVMVLKDMVSV